MTEFQWAAKIKLKSESGIVRGLICLIATTTKKISDLNRNIYCTGRQLLVSAVNLWPGLTLSLYLNQLIIGN